VSRAAIAAVIAQLPAIRAAEASLEAKVKAGLEVPGFFQDIIDQGRVTELP
jgi:hypothetical protein